jgi:hypothetical protein
MWLLWYSVFLQHSVHIYSLASANASATAIEWNTSNFKRETLAVDPPIPLRRTELYRGQNASIPDGSNFNKNSLKSRLVGVGEAGSICELDLGNFAVVHFEDKMSREIMDICNGNEPSGPLDSFSATFVTHSITLTASEVAYVNKKYVGAKSKFPSAPRDRIIA